MKNERQKTAQYIETLEGSIPQALQADNKDLAAAREYLETLDAKIAEEEAALAKVQAAEEKARKKRELVSRKKIEALHVKIVALKEEIVESTDGLELTYKNIAKSMNGAMGRAVGTFIPTKK